jgi:hypothetical protein
LPTVSAKIASFNCTAEHYFCDLKNSTESIFYQIIKDALDEHPYLNQPTTRQRRGWFNFIGEIDNSLFGIATDRQIDELHVTDIKILQKQKSFEDDLIDEHKYVASFASNVTAWTENLAKSVEADLDEAKVKLLEAVDTVYKEDAVLGDISSTILKSQYIFYVTKKIEAAADSCR